jgi:hypothetical protein
VGIERIRLGLHRSADARVAGVGEALGEEPRYALLTGSGHQGVRALDPQPVGLGERAVHVPGEAHVRQRRRLVHDGVGLRLVDGLSHGPGVEQIERDRLGPE